MNTRKLFILILPIAVGMLFIACEKDETILPNPNPVTAQDVEIIWQSNVIFERTNGGGTSKFIDWKAVVKETDDADFVFPIGRVS